MSATPRTPDNPTIRTHGLQGILAMVPYLLGFHPDNALVLVLFDQRRVVLTLRLDITQLLDDPAGVAQFADTQMHRVAAGRVLIVAYTDEPDPDVATTVADLGLALDVEALSRSEQSPVLDVIHVAAGRYRSLTCTDPDCCPAEGHDYQAVLDDPAAAEAVLNGLPARTNRDALRALITPGSEPGDDAYQRTIAETAHQAEGTSPLAVAQAMDRQLRAIEDTNQLPAPQTLAELTGLALNPSARDVATLRIERSSSDLWAQVWAAAARRTDGLAVVAPLGLVGLAAWARGDGALVTLSLEEAEQRCPDHGLVTVLRDVVAQGLHPDVWARMRDQSLAEFGPLGPASRAE